MWAERVYRWLLLAYPTPFRRSRGVEMRETFRDAYAAARNGGRLEVIQFWGRTLADLAASAFPERMAQWGIARPPHAPTPAPLPKPTGRLMDSLLQDLRYASRNIVRRPAFTATVVLTLALGIGANTTVFSLVNEVLLRPMPITDPERVAQIYTAGSSGGGFGSSSYLDFVDFRASSESFVDIAGFYQSTPVNLSTEAVAEQINAQLVSGNYFSVVGVAPALGRVFGLSDDVTVGGHPVAMLSHGLWRRRFGARESVIGETITLNDAPFTVIGVAPDGFRGITLSAAPDVWLPLKMVGAAAPFFQGFPIFESRGGRWLSLVGRLRDGVSADAAQTEMNVIMAGLAEQYPRSNLGTLTAPDQPRAVGVLPASQAAIGGGFVSTTVERARLLLITVGLVLLIACANIANLLLSRALARQREIAVRMALGAGRARLVRQLLTESSLLAFGGGVVGLGFAWWLGRALIPLGLSSALSGFIAVPALTIDVRVLGFTLALAVTTGLLFGIAPALRATTSNIVPALKHFDQAASKSRRRFGLRDGMVVVQVATSLMLLMGAGLFVRSLQAAYASDLGFNPRGVLLTTVNVSRQGMTQVEGEQFYRRLLEGVLGIPGVQSASLAMNYPVDVSGARADVLPEGYVPQDGEDMELSFNIVAPGYFRTLEIPILQGEAFSRRHAADGPAVAVVNQTLAERYWPGENPVGRRFQFGFTGGEVEVIGMSAGGKYRNIREDPIPYLYVPLAQAYRPGATLSVRTVGRPLDIAPAVQDIVHALDPTMPLIDTQTLRDHLGNHLAQDRTTAVLIGALGLLALMIATVGVYGVMSYAVTQRTQELGIRSALGASRTDLLAMVVGYGLRLAGAGLAVGAAGALTLTRLIEGFLFGVSATDPVTFAGVLALLAATALLASYVPGRRAARVDPMRALRYE